MHADYVQKFLNQMAKNKHKPAIIFNEESISYHEANQYSDSLASYLLRCDIGPKKIIPLILERDITTIISMLAAFKAGYAFLPISPITPCSRIKFILDDTKAKFVISNIELQENVIDANKIIDPSNIMRLNLQLTQPVYTDNNSTAYTMYTSGSTGIPKGVLIQHNSMMNLFDSLIEVINISAEDQFLALTDYTFDISLIELLLPLLQGATIVLTEQGTVADGCKIKKHLEESKISIMQATPLTWEILLKQKWTNNNTMKILVGGEKFKTSLAKSLNYQHGNIWNMYGPTETSMWSMYNNLYGEIITETVPLGLPLKNTCIKILDSELNDVAKNTKGELFIGGDGLAKGYLNNEELTNEKFIYHPNTGQRLYRTGDLAIDLDNSGICYIGRSDDQLKFGGIRIEAGEIESFIEQEPFVKKAVVKAHETNEYYKTLAAYIEIDEEQLFANEIYTVNFEYTNFMKNIYDETYTSAEKHEKNLINNCGWQSSFNGELFNPNELLESISFAKKQIMLSDLSSVLEAGCGTGALLLDYIDKAEKCTIVEISIKAIDYIRKKLTQSQQNKINFKNESIINIHDNNMYTCVIVNSVLQYLPSVESIISTIKQLVSSTKPGGTIILGDIRSLELMELYILEKMRQNNLDANNLEQHLNTFYYKSRDAEITLSPNFFYSLQTSIKNISHIDINVKHGSYVNELNYFRYDVIIHIQKEISFVPALTLQYDNNLNTKYVKDLVNNNTKTPIVIEGIPNSYTQEIINNLCHSIKGLPINLQKLEAKEKQRNPAKILSACANLSTHDVFLNYNVQSPINQLDICLLPKDGTNVTRCIFSAVSQPLKSYFREPFNPWVQQFCFEHIKLKIKQNVLSWVMPSVYVWIEKWPVSINGKLDKKKLLLPISNNSVKKDSEVIEQLQTIWRNITGDDILLDKEFWVHGVSSLSMYFFLSNINEVFAVNINYHEFRDYSTLKKLAKHIEKLLGKNKVF